MPDPSKIMRLDALLVANGAFPSRARAQGAIAAGLVTVDGAVATKAATLVSGDAAICVHGDVHDYVSRGGVKLAAALDHFAIDPRDKVCLDLGASTGGFTEVLLRRGAAKVYAVDVGKAQLHPRIAADPRVTLLEGTHAKDLSAALVPDPVAIVVCDVSFISLTKALPAALALCAPGAKLVALIKPQFELGPGRIGKGGVAKASEAELADLARTIEAFLAARGWRTMGVIESPIPGGDGNREFLIAAHREA